VTIRNEFPEEGSNVEGGICDGYEYRVVFAGSRLSDVYQMVRVFLEEQGYGDVPIPANSDEMRCFKTQKTNLQPGLFDLKGYIHNPIKILFLPSKPRRITLGLFLYNELAEGHLLRFHGVSREVK
jgi:hypothetical protein